MVPGGRQTLKRNRRCGANARKNAAMQRFWTRNGAQHGRLDKRVTAFLIKNRLNVSAFLCYTIYK